MGGCDQSQMKIKFKKFEKVKSVPKDIPKSHNDDNGDPYTDPSVVSGLWASGSDNRESWLAEAKGSELGSECAEASGSAHQVGSAGVNSMTDVESE